MASQAERNGRRADRRATGHGRWRTPPLLPGSTTAGVWATGERKSRGRVGPTETRRRSGATGDWTSTNRMTASRRTRLRPLRRPSFASRPTGQRPSRSVDRRFRATTRASSRRPCRPGPPRRSYSRSSRARTPPTGRSTRATEERPSPPPQLQHTPVPSRRCLPAALHPPPPQSDRPPQSLLRQPCSLRTGLRGPYPRVESILPSSPPLLVHPRRAWSLTPRKLERLGTQERRRGLL